MRAIKIILQLTLGAALALAVLACRNQEPISDPGVEEPAGERVENTTVGVAIAALPPFFEVAANDGDALELVPAAADDGARLTVVAGEAEIGGINLVAAIEDHKAELLARPDGAYKGQRELGTQLGTAFYSRGQYTGEDGATEEETVIYLVHPRQDRTLQLIYRYPAGDDSSQRIQEQLFAVLEELEPLAAPGEEETEG